MRLLALRSPLCAPKAGGLAGAPPRPAWRPAWQHRHAGTQPGGGAARQTPVPPCSSGKGGKVVPKEFFDLADKFGDWNAELSGKRPGQRQTSSSTGGTGNGVYSLLLINFGLFLVQKFWSPAWIGTLALSHWAPQWWQFVTASFLHANWEHLSSNAFSLLIFGRIVEEEEGWFGVWATYLVCGIGGCVASYLASPHTHTVSLGASAAVFGLFMVGVLTKFKPSLRRLLEAVILGQFVVKQVLNEVQMVAGGRGLTLAGMHVGHIAHLAGAAVGVALVLLLARLPEVGDS